jgi:hypothetical protein
MISKHFKNLMLYIHKADFPFALLEKPLKEIKWSMESQLFIEKE